jgi:hypothetical protein
MTRDIKAELEDRGIYLRKWHRGEHRAPCPECDRGPRDDALAVRIDADGATWICPSAHNLSAFPVLPGIEALTVLVDHDKPNPRTGRRAGIEAALTLVQRYAAAGFDPDRDIKVILPPTEGHDAADLAGGDCHV